ncbi:MAG: copper resistance protein CopD [Vicingaceae bacterium]
MIWLITLHLMGASIWIGGHLVLTLRILPEVLKSRNFEPLLYFEKKYEKVGMPALLLQIVTGVILALKYSPTLIAFETAQQTAISIKFFLLFATIALAISARLFIFPKLNDKNLNLLALHIVLVTLFSVGFLLCGVAVRFGGLG